MKEPLCCDLCKATVGENQVLKPNASLVLPELLKGCITIPVSAQRSAVIHVSCAVECARKVILSVPKEQTIRTLPVANDESKRVMQVTKAWRSIALKIIDPKQVAQPPVRLHYAGNDVWNSVQGGNKAMFRDGMFNLAAYTDKSTADFTVLASLPVSKKVPVGARHM